MNLLDEWWNNLNLDVKRKIVCNESKNCAECPLLICENCDDVNTVKEFIEADNEGATE